MEKLQIDSRTIGSLINSGVSVLKTDESNLEARILLQHVLNVNHAWLIAHEHDALEANIHAAYTAC